jgi:hypothetical protein
MALAFDAASDSGSQTTNTYSFNHTVGSGTGKVLLVGVAQTAGNVTSVTYNSIALTQVNVITKGTLKTTVLRLINPPTGTFSVAVTLTTNPDSASGAISYFGADQQDPIDSSTTSTGVGAASVTVTPTIDDCLVLAVVGSGTPNAGTEAAGQTNRYVVFNGTTLTTRGSEHNGAVTPAAPTTVSWTGFGGTRSWAIVGISLKPDRAVNVNDSPTTSESVETFLKNRVDVFDSSATSESVALDKKNNISVFNSSVTSESVTVQVTAFQAVFDATATSESVTVLLPQLFLSVFDSVATQDVPSNNVFIGPITSDSAATSESVSLFFSVEVSVFDSTVTSESVTVQLSAFQAISDSTTTSEQVTVELPLPISVFESSTVVDLPGYYPDLVITTEEININQVYDITVSDSSTITEQIVQAPIPNPSVFDHVSIVEFFLVAFAGGVDLIDDIDVDEFVDIGPVPNPFAFDSTTVTESSSVSLDKFLVSVFDSTVTSEFVNTFEAEIVPISDQITVTDFLGYYPDTVYVLENVGIVTLLPFHYFLTDDVFTSELTSVTITSTFAFINPKKIIRDIVDPIIIRIARL